MENSPYRNQADVTAMFNNIAHRYDFLNHLLSAGIDRYWRRRAVRIIGRYYENPDILDVATGTGDMAIAAVKLSPLQIKGIDISSKMLDLGRKKIKLRGLGEIIDLQEGDSENIPFPDNSFDVAMVAFGVRNFADPLKGLSEMTRVIRDGGMVLVLEFSNPTRFPVRQIYNFYFMKVLPLLGRFFSGDSAAYSYLPESVLKFPDNESFMSLMSQAGLRSVKQKRLALGIASIYTGLKLREQ